MTAHITEASVRVNCEVRIRNSATCPASWTSATPRCPRWGFSTMLNAYRMLARLGEVRLTTESSHA